MHATFVLSTGRSGTQWLTEKLRTLYPEDVIEHEPLFFDYRPDINTESAPLARNKELLLQHLANIQQHLSRGKHYIETGFPCWRHLDWFKQQLHGQVKIIHIHRAPLQTVSSLLKLNAFVPPLLPHLPMKNFFLPTEGQGYLKQWQQLWPHLNPAEKNLWYWAELHSYALKLQDQWSPSDWLSLSFDQLFTPASAQALVDFLGQPDHTNHAPLGPIDHYGDALVPYPLAFPLLRQASDLINALAQRLGYDSPLQ
jgi:hypothetical protein